MLVLWIFLKILPVSDNDSQGFNKLELLQRYKQNTLQVIWEIFNFHYLPKLYIGFPMKGTWLAAGHNVHACTEL